jgi:hypothetical protein
MEQIYRLQSSRFELKFLVDEGAAGAIRDFVASYLGPDDGSPEGCDYQVNSLYFDTPDLKLYRQTTQGLKNRFKLRVRFYDEREQSPAFLEIKTRLTNEVRKERAAVTREGARRLLAGLWPRDDQVLDRHRAKGLDALHRFCSLRDSLGAVGASYVSYRREAYVALGSEHVRVTFDRNLRGGAFDGAELRLPPELAQPPLPGVVLELKFTDRFPRWMHELVQIFSLERCSVPKYVHCIEALGMARSGSRLAPRRSVG